VYGGARGRYGGAERNSLNQDSMIQGCFSLHPKNFLPTPPSFSKKTTLLLLKMTLRLFFSKYFYNVFSGTHFINFGFTNPEIKKCIPKKIF